MDERNSEKLKVMIVDDEELSRKFIVSSLDWESFHLEIISEANSGLEALTLLEDQAPDIIFTDIKMPYMDGLELSELISKKYPHIKIVVLTAFKDFDYAQKSIAIGVSHFLLKPINKIELQSTIIKLKEQIALEKKNWFELGHLKKILKDNYEFLRERFLLGILEDDEVAGISQQQFSYYYPDGIPYYVQVTLLETNNTSFADLSEEEQILQDMKSLEFVKSYINNNSCIEVLTDKKHHLILISYSPEIKMVTFCEQIQCAIQKVSGLNISFGIGNAYNDLRKISLSYKEGMESLKYSKYMPSQSITIYENDIHVQNTTWHVEQSVIDDVKFYIKAGLIEELNKILSLLYFDDKGTPIGLDNTRILSMTLLTSAMNVTNDIGIPLQELFEEGTDFFLSMSLELSCNELRVKTISYLNKLTSRISAYRLNKSKSILWDMIQYIQKEIANPNLSLSVVAEEFHMNDSYLSRTFKKELGFSFSKYLNRLRMDHAIELINSTDMKAYQIAEAVGIPDAYYFSNCFKKYTGKSIRDYKKQLTNSYFSPKI